MSEEIVTIHITHRTFELLKKFGSPNMAILKLVFLATTLCPYCYRGKYWHDYPRETIKDRIEKLNSRLNIEADQLITELKIQKNILQLQLEEFNDERYRPWRIVDIDQE